MPDMPDPSEAPSLLSLPGLEFAQSSLTLTPELATKLVTAIRAGCSRYAAAHLAGIPAATLYHWLDTANDKPTSVYGSLLAYILKAEAEYEESHVKALTRKCKTVTDHLDVLGTHPSHRERWGRQEKTQTAIVVHIGTGTNTNDTRS